MSCEGNRSKFFEHIQSVCGINADVLEKIYQASKAAGVPNGKEQEVTEKTRLLFRDMQEIGLRPPTHSPDGLPKLDSRAGYAAILDYLRSSVRPETEKMHVEDSALWPLSDLNPKGLDGNSRNRAGFAQHRFVVQKESGQVWDVWKNVWSGSSSSGLGSGSAGFYNLFQDFKSEKNDFLAYLASADAQGYFSDGYHLVGFDRDGWNQSGYNIYGLRKNDLSDAQLLSNVARRRITAKVSRPNRVKSVEHKVDIEGFSPEDGFRPQNGDESLDYDRFGFNRLGFRQGRSWTGYDEQGLDSNGHPAPARPGYDAWGYERKTGLTAPDAQGRRYNLIGWIYDPVSGDCVNPDDPSQRMAHAGSWGYSTKYKKVVLKRSYIPDENELKARLRNPQLHWNECQKGGYPPLQYGAIRDYKERTALIAQNSILMRYLRSEERARRYPNATHFGIYLRCPRCGQFTGAKPHQCPAFGNEKVIVARKTVIALRKDAFRLSSEEGSGIRDAIDDMMDFEASNYLNRDETEKLVEIDIHAVPGLFHEVRWRDLMAGWKKEEGETAVVLEAPNTPLDNYDPDYHGGLFAGFHWKSGLDKEGRDIFGFHYLSGRRPDGANREDVKAYIKLRTMLEDATKMLSLKGKSTKDVLEATYSRIATAFAGAPRTVHISEEGGPRAEMFWTDMKGRIQAERYPLLNTPNNNEINNLIALKAGLYHELGHEEDTPVGIFRRVVRIASGEEEVDGLPKNAAGIVAEIYNILEDGRMERAQARRRRGVANLLASCALIQPRWDERVGEDIPLSHQIMGMMLYRSLPFFRVRPEVFAAAPERVRKLYLEVEPLVDRAMRSPEETFQASIEISRKLIEADPEIRQFAEKMTAEKSQGGKWAQDNGSPSIIISALPRPGAGSPDESVQVPSPGWGRRDENEALLIAGRAQEQETSATGSKSGVTQQQNENEQENQKDKNNAEVRSAGSAGEINTNLSPSPEPDDEFFSAISSSSSLSSVANDISADIRYGVNVLMRSPIGRALQKPIEAAGALTFDDPDYPEKTYTVRTPVNKNTQDHSLIQKLREEGRDKGYQVARRLEMLKEEIHRRARLKTSGELDRKRFKRALAGADTVYKQQDSFDITSLAVSLQLDMSGSMDGEIRNGHLAATTLALEEALKRLEADYMVTGFGTEYALFKSFGDKVFATERAAAMLNTSLGGTAAAPAMRLAALGLRETSSANKLHIVMTDGAFYDDEESARQAQEMRQNGIIPFGIFFGPKERAPREQMDKIFGDGHWTTIQHLSDLPEQVGRRIEQIYRKILASR